MPATILLDIPPQEQEQMRAALRRARYGYLLALHILRLPCKFDFHVSWCPRPGDMAVVSRILVRRP
jgi:hypothetical protein